jgi:hypothetical protein
MYSSDTEYDDSEYDSDNETEPITKTKPTSTPNPNPNNQSISYLQKSDTVQHVLPVVQLTQPQLVENVKKWTLLDSQLKIVYEKTKKMREYKSKLGKEIIQYMESKNKLKAKIQITNGELSFYEKKEYTPLSYSYIETCLAEIIRDKSQVRFIMEYLKEKRNIKTKTEIRRTYQKQNMDTVDTIHNMG